MTSRVSYVCFTAAALVFITAVRSPLFAQAHGHDHSHSPTEVKAPAVPGADQSIAPAQLQAESMVQSQEEQRKLENTLSKYYQAIGGSEKFSAVQSCKITGRYVSADGGWKKRYTVFVKGSKVRVEMDIQAGMKMVQSYDGLSGWSIMPWSGSLEPQPMNAENSRALAVRNDLFRNDLIVFKETGSKLSLHGSEEIDGSDCIKIVALRPDGVSKEYFLDADSYLIVKVITKYRMNDEDVESENYYSNYRLLNGMLLPFAAEDAGGGGMYFETYEVNPAIDDAVFSMPKKG